MNILNGYITAALWSSDDDNDEPLDINYDDSHLDEITLFTMAKDCDDFVKKTSRIFKKLNVEEDQIGHDFWLTRNNHGVGFWDRPEEYGGQLIADKLSKLAKSFGECHLFVSENKIYL